MNKKRLDINNKLAKCKQKLIILLSEIEKNSKNIDLSIEIRLNKTKIIREEINKVGTEIDSLKKEITMLGNLDIN